LAAACATLRIDTPKEDPMVNQFQASLLTTPRQKAGHPIRLALVQAAAGFRLVLLVSAFGLFAASHAIGDEAHAAAGPRAVPAATANVLPDLVIWPESLEPNLSGTLATGDGGATIELQ
jgi:hypothetical protein